MDFFTGLSIVCLMVWAATVIIAQGSVMGNTGKRRPIFYIAWGVLIVVSLWALIGLRILEPLMLTLDWKEWLNTQ
ncbi:MAG: hypothetical protein COV74_04655 [Candidatus Omnitrophica bacterium CG11_big_fil_rev_8_21_14_0_20_45_26]|uniref:Uncharacterized protein n=1 Tax=Candidatus Abzuiibacterium crystallinum TaxID=1974748 RepID=A0A2H0LPV7_9BACT|nr:MAG: hypothetical protein COV74_04655 [Candidatus Omnitrophica bacterium CG11_big_fil_rev_8_21_14_0_20_45_26]PIW64053.1 MAG: hypothetical protein COW12_07780 [Candidatus Omnitrophica bacterium CG12_big_fil_rev_8_21_14_0_65_45_16]